MAEPALTLDDRAASERVARVETLLEEIEGLHDEVARDKAFEVVQALLDVYGEGLARIVSHVAARDDGALAAAFGGDELVAHLLLLHGLHPVPLEQRVREALEEVRPYLESHGGDVELLGIENGIAKLRLQGSCKSCRASSSTLELAVRQALEEAAPDLEGMDVEGIVEEDEELEVTGVPLPLIQMNGTPSWHTLSIDVNDELVATDVGGVALVVANVEGTLLAYRNRCADCGGALDGGALKAGALRCPTCGRSYFLPQAGRSMDDDHLQLQPIPLLREQEEIRVAL
jgi:Fe-S cluster biogenesis protein NfuA/nitrite reductase/ring-hydroxylating ferredoxin subunit